MFYKLADDDNTQKIQSQPTQDNLSQNDVEAMQMAFASGDPTLLVGFVANVLHKKFSSIEPDEIVGFFKNLSQNEFANQTQEMISDELQVNGIMLVDGNSISR